MRRSGSRPFLAALALLALVGCTGGDELDGTSWRAIELETGPTEPGVESTIAFDGGEVSGSGGCNTYSGAYEAQLSSGMDGGGPDTISIVNVGGTEMACAEQIMAQEAAFFDALTRARTYRLEGGRLELIAGDQVVVALVLVPDG